MFDLQRELILGIEALELASDKVLKIYNSLSLVEAQLKSDNSPISEADQVSNQIIVAILKSHFDYPILSEETDDNLSRLSAKKIWILDPLDGTREFLAKRNEFTINLALIEDGEVILGVVAAPAQQQIYYACKGKGAFLKNGPSTIKIQVKNKKTLTNLDVAVSRSHLNPDISVLLGKINNCNVHTLGSALKYCLVASGEIDAAIRKTPLYEWDLAAPSCILKEAGGAITNLLGEPFVYNQRKALFEDGVLVANQVLHKILLSDIVGV